MSSSDREPRPPRVLARVSDEFYRRYPHPPASDGERDERAAFKAQRMNELTAEHEAARVRRLEAQAADHDLRPGQRLAADMSLREARDNLRFAHEGAVHFRRLRRPMVCQRRSAPRARGAGRPRARSVARSSSRGGDGGDSGSSEGDGEHPPPARALVPRRDWLRWVDERLKALDRLSPQVSA